MAGNKIKAVIFDMDGVLIDAREWHYDALNQALALFGFEITRHEHLSTFDGLPTRRKLEIISEEKQLPSSLHDFINKMKQQFTMNIVHSQCKPTFIHQYALSRLKLNGYKIAVASNSVRNSVISMMERAALMPFLDFVLSNEDVERPKPDPEIYSKAIAMFGLKPSQCLIVEDNDHGIRAARESGAHVMEVNDVEDVIYENILEAIIAAENQSA